MFYYVTIDGVPRCGVREANGLEIMEATPDALLLGCSYPTRSVAENTARFVADYFAQRNRRVTVDVVEGDCPFY